jgi:hypothetical protein
MVKLENQNRSRNILYKWNSKQHFYRLPNETPEVNAPADKIHTIQEDGTELT